MPIKGTRPGSIRRHHPSGLVDSLLAKQLLKMFVPGGCRSLYAETGRTELSAVLLSAEHRMKDHSPTFGAPVMEG